MLAEYHEDELMPTASERLTALEVELREARKDQEEYRRDSRHERKNMQMALESQITLLDRRTAESLVGLKKDQIEIGADLKEIKQFFQAAKGIKWFIGFVTTTIAALSSLGIYKLFFPK